MIDAYEKVLDSSYVGLQAFTAHASCKAAFAFSTILRNTANASEGSWCLNRSSLFTIRSGFNRSAQAARRAPRVWTRTPSTASTTTKQPSDNLQAAQASCAKSTWPGLSMIVSKKSLVEVFNGEGHRSDTAEALKVMPRSCSSGRSSINRKVPASRGGIAPPSAKSQSTKELLPWSTWPMTQIVRHWFASFCNALSSWAVGRRLLFGGGGGWAMLFAVASARARSLANLYLTAGSDAAVSRAESNCKTYR